MITLEIGNDGYGHFIRWTRDDGYVAKWHGTLEECLSRAFTTPTTKEWVRV